VVHGLLPAAFLQILRKDFKPVPIDLHDKEDRIGLGWPDSFHNNIPGYGDCDPVSIFLFQREHREFYKEAHANASSGGNKPQKPGSGTHPAAREDKRDVAAVKPGKFPKGLIRLNYRRGASACTRPPFKSNWIAA
jgi:hypothetical protein